ncbi:MAG: STAS domain-containing protein [Vulcanimicrobiaceae bacterium]
MTVPLAADRLTTTVRLRGELDLRAREYLDLAMDPLANAPLAIIDMSRVTYADATFLAAVTRLRWARDVRGCTERIHIVGADRAIAHVCSLASFDQYLHFVDPVVVIREEPLAALALVLR